MTSPREEPMQGEGLSARRAMRCLVVISSSTMVEARHRRLGRRDDLQQARS